MKKYTKKTIEFYDKYIAKYTRNSTVVLKRKINKFIKLLPGPKILDVACGPGHDTDYLTKKGFDCLGIDLSKKMIEYAKKNYQGKFKVMDFFNLKFKANTFDGIWCSSALTHVTKEDLNKLLKDFLKIIKKEGVLGIIIPKMKKRNRKKTNTRVFTMFYRYEISKYLIESGFRIISSDIFSLGNINWIFVIVKKPKNNDS